MSISLVKNVNFGMSQQGLGTVGFTLIGSTGLPATSRITLGVYEVGTLTGIYAAQVTFPTGFHGSILWDTGAANPKYASEEYSPLEEQTQFSFDISGGKWTLDANTNEMIFYSADNVTEIARFKMHDQNNTPSIESVFTRTRI